MNKKELMNLGITDEQADSILDMLKDSYVPLSRFNEINDKMKKYRSDLDDKIEENKTLSSKVKDSEKQDDEIRSLKEAKEKAENALTSTVNSLKRDYAVEGKVRDRKAKNVKAVMALIDMDKVTFENGELGGVDDQLDALVEGADSKFMFDTAPTYAPKGTQPGENTGGSATGGARSFGDAIANALNLKK